MSTVTRVMRTEPGLQDAWHRTRYLAAQERARSSWLSVLHAHGSLGTKYLRSLDPANYAWLYRNDRTWLQSQTAPRVAKLGGSGLSTVRWDERDAELCKQVERVALMLQAEQGLRGLKLWQLYQHIPELKAKLAALDRLPLTRRAIERALRPGREDKDKTALLL